MKNVKKIFGTLIIGMAFTLWGCGATGGTVTFTNDSGGSTCVVGIAVWETDGSPKTPTGAQLADGETISASLDRDGTYKIYGVYMPSGSDTSITINKTGDLAGGACVALKATDF